MISSKDKDLVKRMSNNNSLSFLFSFILYFVCFFLFPIYKELTEDPTALDDIIWEPDMPMQEVDVLLSGALLYILMVIVGI